MDTSLYVTASGLQNIKAELNELNATRLPEAEAKIRAALQNGEPDENPDYDAALQEKAIVEDRIHMLEDAVRFAIVVEDIPSDSVQVGSTVQIAEEGWEDDVEEFRIVSVHEAAPNKGLISNKSPLGSALLGARVGDTVTAFTPGGETRMQVLSIA